MNSSKSVITLTFGDSAENHVGMEKLGTIVAEGQGFSTEDLFKIQHMFPKAELFYLNELEQCPEATVLVIHNGVDYLLKSLSKNKDDLFKEQADLDQDKKAYMYGRVVNKYARWNLCFDEEGHEPNYEQGQGRVVPYSSVPLTKALREFLASWIGSKAEGLKCEGNYYYDKNTCGIGFHGDSERRKVIGVRLGAAMTLHYQWFLDGKPVGNRIKIPLKGGDMYIMSEKAVGTDWKMKSIYTLRHATGSVKYTTI